MGTTVFNKSTEKLILRTRLNLLERNLIYINIMLYTKDKVNYLKEELTEIGKELSQFIAHINESE